MTDDLTTRERIRVEAAALFRKRGFNGTSMADLAQEVGISKSSLYHHFPSKQALLSEIIELTVNRVTPLVRAVADSDLPIEERLRSAIALHTVEAIRDRDAIACFIEEGRYLSSDFMATHITNRDRYEMIFRDMFEEGITSAELVDQDIGIAVKAILGMCNSVVRWYQPSGKSSPEEIADEIAEFVVRGASPAQPVGFAREAQAHARST
ncbi:MAG: TetR/AcrR family transcriptional regulator [Acidimicrobiia bacterium]|nr:MAG: TetR/AcrR family transcriptional regulator [Acidimicrobiia bacterium]